MTVDNLDGRTCRPGSQTSRHFKRTRQSLSPPHQATGLLGTIIGTVSGVLLTQRRSDRRELAAWERQREREHELWEREDALRNFEQRREACIGFYEMLREMSRTA